MTQATEVTAAADVDLVDPRLLVGSYVTHGDSDKRSLWRVQGPHRDQHGKLTGKHELENARGQWSAVGHETGYWVHQRIIVTQARLVTDYQLVKSAPRIEHLDQQMSEHLQAQNQPPAGGSRLAPRSNLSGWEAL
jgi:hypothetical protein